ncbi:MAG: hypothetical protein JNK85_24195 [Verrucomicrobiales bacterium]|nr:hypothetical protein [Verrucomicrobiales bacterium]
MNLYKVLVSIAWTMASSFAADQVHLIPNTRPPAVTGNKGPYSGNTESREALYRLGQMIQIMNPLAAKDPVVLRVKEGRPLVPAKEAHSTLRPLIAAASLAVGPVVRVVSLDNEERQIEVIEAGIGRPGTPAFNRDFLATNTPNFFTIEAHLTRWDERIDITRRAFFLNLLFGLKGTVQVEPSVDFERENEISELGYEFTLEDPMGFQVPYSQTPVTMALAKGVRSDRIGLLLLGSGGKWAGYTQRSDGFHDATIRSVDHGILMLLGKLFKVPYWRCLRNGGDRDSAVVDLIRGEFLQFDEVNRLRLVQRYLTLCGFPVQETGELDPPTRLAVAGFCDRRGLPRTDVPTPEFYVELHLAMPMPFPTTEHSPRMPAVPSTGLAVHFHGFPSDYSDALFGILDDSSISLRVVRDRGNPMVFQVIDYRGKARQIAYHIQKGVARRLPGCTGSRVDIEAESIIHVHWKGEDLRYAARK